MAIQRHHDIVHRHAEFFRRCTDDTQVSLMRYRPVQLRTVKIIRRQRLINDVRQFRYRNLEDFVAAIVR